MQLDRYYDLYISETREHLRILADALMDLEAGDEAEAIAAAFRAAHTIKGMAATMGFEEVADHAHRLEDRLQEVRAGDRRIDAELLDVLLAEVDGLGAVAGIVDGEEEEHSPATDAASPTGTARSQTVETVPAESVAGADGTQGARYVRVEQRHLVDLADGIGDLTILLDRLERLGASAEVPGLDDLLEQVSHRVDELRHTVLAARMVPVAEVFDRFRRLVRDAARSLGKEVEFSIVGGDIEMDREILTELSDPILHLLRNAIDHGIESPDERVAAGKPARGQLELRVSRARSRAQIEIIDDGRGVDRERVEARARALGTRSAGADETLLSVLSQPGLSTAREVSDLSGRGVGLDVVVTRVRTLGGAITLESDPDRGTSVALQLPITLALTQALHVEVVSERYVLPLTHISEAVDLDREPVESAGGGEVLVLRGDRIPLVRLRRLLEAPGGAQEPVAIVVELGERRVALAVDRIVGRDQVIIRSFDAAVGTLPVFSGATLLSDGRAALVLDPMSVF